ncbi:MAG: MFS transporter, partial [Thermodesulfobacteriota bacterium]
YVISLYFALYLKQVGASIVRIGDVFSTGQTVYFAAALLCGLISDRLSKKALFVLGLTVVGIGVIAIGLSRAVLLILFCYLVREMGRAFIHSMQWPVIAYILPPDVRATANALYLTVIYMGCMMTSLITGFTISMFPLWHVFMLGGLMSIAGGIVVYFNIESTEREIHAQAQPTRY